MSVGQYSAKFAEAQSIKVAAMMKALSHELVSSVILTHPPTPAPQTPKTA
jgi:hypothetical protein